MGTHDADLPGIRIVPGTTARQQEDAIFGVVEHLDQRLSGSPEWLLAVLPS